MVSTQDRPIPAPRISLTDRKPPVPSRILKPAVILNPATALPDSANRIPNSWLYPTYLPIQNLLSRNLRRVKSLSDISKTVTTNVNRFALSNIQSAVDFRDKPDEILNSEGLERGRVGRIAKMLDAVISGNSTIRSIDEQKGSSANVSLVAGQSFSSVIEKSRYLPENETVSVAVNQGDSNILMESKIENVARNGLWNSGYIGLEAYSRMMELFHDDDDDVSSNNG